MKDVDVCVQCTHACMCACVGPQGPPMRSVIPCDSAEDRGRLPCHKQLPICVSISPSSAYITHAILTHHSYQQTRLSYVTYKLNNCAMTDTNQLLPAVTKHTQFNILSSSQLPQSCSNSSPGCQ